MTNAEYAVNMDRLRLIPSCTCCLSGYHLPLWAGLGGIFAARGLQVEIAEPQGRIGSVRSVASGRYDCCLTSVRNFIEAKEFDPRLAARYVLMVSRRSHIAAFTLARGTARPARSVEDFDQLNGASFLRYTDASYMGAPEYLPLLQLLRLHPGAIIDVQYSELYEALAEGRGEVAVSWLNLLPDLHAIARRQNVHVQAFPFCKAGLNVYGSGIVASQDLMDTRPEVLQRFLLALREALEAVRRDPGIALRVFRERYPDRDTGRATDVWNAGKQLIFGDDDAQDALGTMDTATWRATIEHHARSYGSAYFSPQEAFDPTIVARTTTEEQSGSQSPGKGPRRPVAGIHRR